MPELAAAAAIAASGLVASAGWFPRRSLVRRLASVAARLDGGVPDADGVEEALARLERAASIAERRLREAEDRSERFASVLGSVRDGVVVCDEHGRVVYRNAIASALAASRTTDVLAERAVAEALEQACRGEREERTVELFSPTRRVLLVVAEPLDDGRSRLGAVALITDVSDLKRLEAMRRDFVANLSHELKTPVGALGLLAETLAGETDPDVVARFVERMQHEAARVGRIIDDLLDLTRIEAEEAPQREPVPVRLAVGEAVERLRGFAEHRGTPVEEDVPRRLAVQGNRRQIVSALHNLLENAIKYSDAGQPVAVRARLVGAWVEIEVEDAGIGIPSRDLERVFERFYRVDRARARDTGGTGLGLAIVRHVVNAHGGDVRVRSQEGEGSTFTLRLPAAPGSLAVMGAEAG